MAWINLSLVGITGLLGLFEILFTVFNFDEDKYGVFNIALVFVLEPIITQAVQFVFVAFMYNGDPSVINLFMGVYEIASESIQCWLYVHFCSFSHQAILCLVLAAVAQIFLKSLNAGISACGANYEDMTEEEKAREVYESYLTPSCVPTCFGGVFDCIGLLLLLIPDSPFLEKSFEVPFACMCWLIGLSINLIIEDKEKMYKDGKMTGEGETTQLAQAVYGMMNSAMFCMIPYTIMITVHFYARMQFPVYILAMIMGSCCLCCFLIMAFHTPPDQQEDEEEELSDVEYNNE